MSTTAHAQTPYVVLDSVGSWSEVTGGSTCTPVPYGFFNAWDEGYCTITLPFTFTWYGNNYSTLYAYTNGFVSFDPPPSSGGLLNAPNVVPSPANPIHNFIGVMWSDLDGPPGAEIRYVTGGLPGARLLTVQYKNLRDFGNPLSSVSFQVTLYEGTSTARIVMGPNNGVTGASTVIENAFGTDGKNLLAPSPSCGAGCTCVPGACGSTNWLPSAGGRTFTITLPAGPELIGEVSGPNGAYPGASFDVHVRLRNLGLGATSPFRWELRLASTNTSTIGSVQLQSLSSAGIGPATTETATVTVTMPPGTPVGRFWLAAALDVDREVLEVIETNNVAFDTHYIATGPDLTGTVSPPATSGPGEPLDVSMSVESFGAPVVSPIHVSFHLSTDPVLDGSDLPLGSGFITLGDGFSGTQVFSLTVPANAPASPPGYYVLAEIDDQNAVAEIDELNNVVASGTTVELSGPDLDVTALDAAPFAFRGQPYPLVATVRNTGGATAHDFTMCVVISRNLLISVISDPILIETAPMTLAPGESAALQLSPTIAVGTSTGAYYLAAVADCQLTVTESAETNNTRRRTDQIVVRDPAPDFSPVEVATATAAAAGETIPVAVRIGNLGNLAGTTNLKLVVSPDPAITVDDTVIWEATTPLSIAANAETSLAVWAPVPGSVASGNYWIGAIVDTDDLVDEVYEDNNASGAGPVAISGSNLAIITPAPPAAVIGVPYVRRFAAVGGTAAYTWSLAWTSGAPGGLAFDPRTAELSGTPAAGTAGRYELTVSVTAGNLSTTRAYSLIVTPPTIPLTIVSSRLPPALAQEPYMLQLVAVGGTAPYRWSLVQDAPSGFGLSEDGQLGGLPQLVGAYRFAVAIDDVAGGHAEATLAIDVVDRNTSVSITTADIPRADLNTEYATTFSVDGGTAPYVWRLERDEAIPGLDFDTSTATLQGTPTRAGEYPFVVEVRDAKGLIDRNAYVLTVSPPGDLVITTGQSGSALPAGKVGALYLAEDGTQARLRAVRRAGGDPGTLAWSVVDGALPPGITADATGVLSGTPTTEGRFAFRVLASSDDGDYAFAALVIEIAPAVVPIPPSNDSGCSCAAEQGGAPAASLVVVLFVVVLLALRPKTRRRATLGLTVIAAGLITARAEAQLVPYTVTQTTEPFVPLAHPVQVMPGLGDGTTAMIALPFDFYLYGVATNVIYVNANGLIATNNFRSGHHFPPSSNPDPTSPEKGWVAGLWDDWCASADCTGPSVPGIGVFYEIDSTPGAGRITVEFRHARHYSDASAPSDLNFQITLHEGVASRIELSYGSMTQGADFFGNPTPFHARIGIMDETGLNGMWLGPCAGVLTCSFANVAALSNQKITIVADAGDDLAATSVSVPQVGYPGLPMSVAARVLSRHGEALGPVIAAAYLVPSTATSTAGATALWTSAPLTFAPFESRLVSFDLEVPATLPIGQYRVAVVVDDRHQLAETDETNNLAASLSTVRIADRAPDFRVLRVRPLEPLRAPGEMIHVAYAVENAGNEPGRLVAQMYLSTNAAISTSDLPLGAPITFTSGTRETFTGTISASLAGDLATGTYWVGVIVDPDLAVPELTESNNVGRAADPVTVSASTVELVTAELPHATLGTAYSATVRAAGGNGTFTYRLANGMLPRGMNFNAQTAEVFGIPLEAGSFTLELQATSGARSVRKQYTLEVIDPSLPLTLVTRALPPAVLGEDYAVTIQAIGGMQPYTWQVLRGSLPSGIFLATDGTLVGIPREIGFDSFEVELRDAASATATVALSIDTRSPGNLTIASSALPEAKLGESYSQQLFAAGGIGSVHWAPIATGSPAQDMPAGLTLTDDGVITGVPEKVGAYRFRVEASDEVGNVDTNLLVLDVLAIGHFEVATESLPDGAPNVAYRAVVKGEGGTPPYTWEIVQKEGSLPPSFSAVSGSGSTPGETVNDLVITGMPTAEGTWAFTVRIHDAAERTSDRPLAIVVREPVEPTVVTEDSGCTCVASTERGAWLAALPFGLFFLLTRRRFVRHAMRRSSDLTT